MQEFEKILNENEEIIWESRPKLLPFLSPSSIRDIGMLVVAFLVAPLFMMLGLLIFSLFLSLLLSVPDILFISYFVPVLSLVVYKILLCRKTKYAITDKRIIVQTGIIGRDFSFIDFDQITNIEVDVNIFDLLFSKSSGTILVFSAGNIKTYRDGSVPEPYKMQHVPDPYLVFKKLKGVSLDVKTDIKYPNLMRKGFELPVSNYGKLSKRKGILLESVLDSKEKILWQSNPVFLPFIFNLVFTLIALSPIFATMGFIFLKSWITSFQVVGILIILIFLYKLLVYKRTHYAITDRRIIIEKGLIGKDFQLIDFDKITNTDSMIGIADKVFKKGTGTVTMSSAATLVYLKSSAINKPYSFQNIRNHNEIVKFLNKISMEFKKDINYPKSLRPATGNYKTGYGNKS